MKDFTNIQFELIDANVNLTPDIFINRGGITFTKRVLEDLNYPGHVQYCINPDQKVFAIRACKGNESKATPFSKPKAEQSQTMSTGNRNIAEPIKALLGSYDPQMRYRVEGHFDAGSRTVYYDLDEAVAEAFRAPKEELAFPCSSTKEAPWVSPKAPHCSFSSASGLYANSAILISGLSDSIYIDSVCCCIICSSTITSETLLKILWYIDL